VLRQRDVHMYLKIRYTQNVKNSNGVCFHFKINSALSSCLLKKNKKLIFFAFNQRPARKTFFPVSAIATFAESKDHVFGCQI
jgi:hypothetical protein